MLKTQGSFRFDNQMYGKFTSRMVIHQRWFEQHWSTIRTIKTCFMLKPPGELLNLDAQADPRHENLE
jgi:hypothetical protein